MRCIMLLTLSLYLLSGNGFAAPLDEARAGLFLRSLASGGAGMDSLVEPGELALATRLGIRYTDQPVKCMIGADLEPQVAEAVRATGILPGHRIVDLGEGFSRLELDSGPSGRGWWFRGGRMISPVTYFTRGWKAVETRHLRVLSADSLQAARTADFLERFTRDNLDRLEFPDSLRTRLERGKLLYVLCRDEDEFERITGWRARGVCLLAWDCVVTVWPCHYHELVHELINLRLGELASDTHPFFLEGLAVGLGGRGGQEVRPILDLAAFLIDSGLLDYTELLDRDGFGEQDASLSYPVAGLYNRFLLEHLGAARYIELYRAFNAPAGSPGWRKAVSRDSLPPEHAWREHLRGRVQFEGVSLEGPPAGSEPLALGEGWAVWETAEGYAFNLSDSLFISLPQPWESRHPRFSHETPDGLSGVSYLLTADSEEIRLVNRVSGNLSANFVSSLSLGKKSVPVKDGRMQFRLSRILFQP